MEKINLRKEDWEKRKLNLYNNHVIVEMVHNNDDLKTKGGIIVGIANRAVYAQGTNSLAADMEECWGVVHDVPNKLYFGDGPFAMDWETDMELQVGDLVWGGIMEFHNALTIVVEDRTFKVIPYPDLFVAKRGDEVIPLNGYALLKATTLKKISDLDVVSDQTLDTTRGIVAFVGKPNKSYKQPAYVDHPNLNKGDEVLLAPRTPILWLERKKEFASFDGDNLYFVVPRRKIVAVIS